ncbi:MAG: Ig-like domain-containing protein [Pseudonocardiaceae bacterium]
MTATVTPATAGGMVQFKDGSADLGPAASIYDGTASRTVSTLTVGSHQLTALFTPANPAAYSASTSPAVLFTISGATATSTTLSTSPAQRVLEGTPVTMTATVTPSTAAGMVQFQDGATNIGAPAAVTNGTASNSATFGVGQHQLSAVSPRPPRRSTAHRHHRPSPLPSLLAPC